METHNNMNASPISSPIPPITPHIDEEDSFDHSPIHSSRWNPQPVSNTVREGLGSGLDIGRSSIIAHAADFPPSNYADLTFSDPSHRAPGDLMPVGHRLRSSPRGILVSPLMPQLASPRPTLASMASVPATVTAPTGTAASPPPSDTILLVGDKPLHKRQVSFAISNALPMRAPSTRPSPPPSGASVNTPAHEAAAASGGIVAPLVATDANGEDVKPTHHRRESSGATIRRGLAIDNMIRMIHTVSQLKRWRNKSMYSVDRSLDGLREACTVFMTQTNPLEFGNMISSALTLSASPQQAIADSRKERIDILNNPTILLEKSDTNSMYQQGDLGHYTTVKYLQRLSNSFNVTFLGLVKKYFDTCTLQYGYLGKFSYVHLFLLIHKQLMPSIPGSEAVKIALEDWNKDIKRWGVKINQPGIGRMQSTQSTSSTPMHSPGKLNKTRSVMTPAHSGNQSSGAADSDSLPGSSPMLGGGLNSGGGGTSEDDLGFTLSGFHAALFQLVDHWTVSCDVSEYISFLQGLYGKMTMQNPDYTPSRTGPGSDRRKVIWKNLTVDYQSALTQVSTAEDKKKASSIRSPNFTRGTKSTKGVSVTPLMSPNSTSATTPGGSSGLPRLLKQESQEQKEATMKTVAAFLSAQGIEQPPTVIVPDEKTRAKEPWNESDSKKGKDLSKPQPLDVSGMLAAHPSLGEVLQLSGEPGEPFLPDTRPDHSHTGPPPKVVEMVRAPAATDLSDTDGGGTDTDAQIDEYVPSDDEDDQDEFSGDPLRSPRHKKHVLADEESPSSSSSGVERAWVTDEDLREEDMKKRRQILEEKKRALAANQSTAAAAGQTVEHPPASPTTEANLSVQLLGLPDSVSVPASTAKSDSSALPTTQPTNERAHSTPHAMHAGKKKKHAHAHAHGHAPPHSARGAHPHPHPQAGILAGMHELLAHAAMGVDDEPVEKKKKKQHVSKKSSGGGSATGTTASKKSGSKKSKPKKTRSQPSTPPERSRSPSSSAISGGGAAALFASFPSLQPGSELDVRLAALESESASMNSPKDRLRRLGSVRYDPLGKLGHETQQLDPEHSLLPLPSVTPPPTILKPDGSVDYAAMDSHLARLVRPRLGPQASVFRTAEEEAGLIDTELGKLDADSGLSASKVTQERLARRAEERRLAKLARAKEILTEGDEAARRNAFMHSGAGALGVLPELTPEELARELRDIEEHEFRAPVHAGKKVHSRSDSGEGLAPKPFSVTVDTADGAGDEGEVIALDAAAVVPGDLSAPLPVNPRRTSASTLFSVDLASPKAKDNQKVLEKGKKTLGGGFIRKKSTGAGTGTGTVTGSKKSDEFSKSKVNEIKKAAAGASNSSTTSGTGTPDKSLSGTGRNTPTLDDAPPPRTDSPVPSAAMKREKPVPKSKTVIQVPKPRQKKKSSPSMAFGVAEAQELAKAAAAEKEQQLTAVREQADEAWLEQMTQLGNNPALMTAIERVASTAQLVEQSLDAQGIELPGKEVLPEGLDEEGRIVEQHPSIVDSDLSSNSLSLAPPSHAAAILADSIATALERVVDSALAGIEGNAQSKSASRSESRASAAAADEAESTAVSQRSTPTKLVYSPDELSRKASPDGLSDSATMDTSAAPPSQKRPMSSGALTAEHLLSSSTHAEGDEDAAAEQVGTDQSPAASTGTDTETSPDAAPRAVVPSGPPLPEDWMEQVDAFFAEDDEPTVEQTPTQPQENQQTVRSDQPELEDTKPSETPFTQRASAPHSRKHTPAKLTPEKPTASMEASTATTNEQTAPVAAAEPPSQRHHHAKRSSLPHAALTAQEELDSALAMAAVFGAAHLPASELEPVQPLMPIETSVEVPIQNNVFPAAVSRVDVIPAVASHARGDDAPQQLAESPSTALSTAITATREALHALASAPVGHGGVVGGSLPLDLSREIFQAIKRLVPVEALPLAPTLRPASAVRSHPKRPPSSAATGGKRGASRQSDRTLPPAEILPIEQHPNTSLSALDDLTHTLSTLVPPLGRKTVSVGKAVFGSSGTGAARRATTPGSEILGNVAASTVATVAFIPPSLQQANDPEHILQTNLDLLQRQLAAVETRDLSLTGTAGQSRVGSRPITRASGRNTRQGRSPSPTKADVLQDIQSFATVEGKGERMFVLQELEHARVASNSRSPSRTASLSPTRTGQRAHDTQQQQLQQYASGANSFTLTSIASPPPLLPPTRPSSILTGTSGHAGPSGTVLTPAPFTNLSVFAQSAALIPLPVVPALGQTVNLSSGEHIRGWSTDGLVGGIDMLTSGEQSGIDSSKPSETMQSFAQSSSGAVTSPTHRPVKQKKWSPSKSSTARSRAQSAQAKVSSSGGTSEHHAASHPQPFDVSKVMNEVFASSGGEGDQATAARVQTQPVEESVIESGIPGADAPGWSHSDTIADDFEWSMPEHQHRSGSSSRASGSRTQRGRRAAGSSYDEPAMPLRKLTGGFSPVSYSRALRQVVDAAKARGTATAVSSSQGASREASPSPVRNSESSMFQSADGQIRGWTERPSGDSQDQHSHEEEKSASSSPRAHSRTMMMLLANGGLSHVPLSVASSPVPGSVHYVSPYLPPAATVTAAGIAAGHSTGQVPEFPYEIQSAAFAALTASFNAHPSNVLSIPSVRPKTAERWETSQGVSPAMASLSQSARFAIGGSAAGGSSTRPVSREDRLPMRGLAPRKVRQPVPPAGHQHAHTHISRVSTASPSSPQHAATVVHSIPVPLSMPFPQTPTPPLPAPPRMRAAAGSVGSHGVAWAVHSVPSIPRQRHDLFATSDVSTKDPIGIGSPTIQAQQQQLEKWSQQAANHTNIHASHWNVAASAPPPVGIPFNPAAPEASRFLYTPPFHQASALPPSAGHMHALGPRETEHTYPPMNVTLGQAVGSLSARAHRHMAQANLAAAAQAAHGSQTARSTMTSRQRDRASHGKTTTTTADDLVVAAVNPFYAFTPTQQTKQKVVTTTRVQA